MLFCEGYVDLKMFISLAFFFTWKTVMSSLNVDSTVSLRRSSSPPLPPPAYGCRHRRYRRRQSRRRCYARYLPSLRGCWGCDDVTYGCDFNFSIVFFNWRIKRFKGTATQESCLFILCSFMLASMWGVIFEVL